MEEETGWTWGELLKAGQHWWGQEQGHHGAGLPQRRQLNKLNIDSGRVYMLLSCWGGGVPWDLSPENMRRRGRHCLPSRKAG